MIHKEEILDFINWAHRRYNIALTAYDNHGHATLSMDEHLLVDIYLKELEEIEDD